MRRSFTISTYNSREVERDERNFSCRNRSTRAVSRHAVWLRWERDSGLIVLSRAPGREASGKTLRLHQVGLHHFAFLVDDLKTMVEKLKRAGVKILLPPYAADAIANGEETGGRVLTA